MHILFTQELYNLKVVRSTIDVTSNLIYVFMLGVFDCNMYREEGIGGNVVFDNNTFVNRNLYVGNCILYTLQRINITFTNNNLTDMYWGSPHRVFLHEQFQIPCPFNQTIVMRYENNTFSYSKKELASYIGFNYKLEYIPRYNVDFIFRGNILNNLTFSNSPIAYIYSRNSDGVRVFFDNNVYTNITASSDQPLFEF